jgi:ribosomal protein L22, bacterial type
MKAFAYAKFIRISPRKVQIVLDQIRGKDIKQAQAILKYTPKAACEPVGKLLNSAIANAEHNFSLDRENLVVSECFVSPGPTLKRIRPVSKGRAHHILKRSSHITLAVAEK